MSNRFVRKSKYRHVFAAPPKRDEVWDGVKMTKNAWDSNFCACSTRWLALAWQVGGGGAVGIIDLKKPGKVDKVGLFTGHKGPVLDLAFSPFHEDILATASEDCFAKIWKIPAGGFLDSISEEAQLLKGHKRKVGGVSFNGVAENILATTGQDYEVKIWDISTGTDALTVSGHGGIIQSCDWDYEGKLLTTFCKDKKLRVVDPRAGTIVQEAETHSGVKGGRALWMGKHERIFSVGVDRSSARQYFVFDSRNFETPLVPATNIDNAAGIIMPFYDEDSDIIFLAGKGDGNIRYYEIDVEADDPKNMVFYISQFGSTEPTAACCSMPKRGCDVTSNEIVRLFKVAGTQVQPLSFKVPRKSDMFQEDIFPDCRSDEAALTASQWLAGDNSKPKTKSLEKGFVPTEKKETSFEKKEAPAELSEADLRKAHEVLEKRVAYLEAELAKRDAKIAELESKNT